MAFVFRLERVLAVRRIQEETAQQRNADAQEALRQAQEADQELRQVLAVALEEFDELKRGDRMTPEALYLHSLHLAGLRRKLEASRIKVEEVAAEAQRAAGELLEAHQAREALERLREREKASWDRDQAQREARHVDEIAVSRHRSREEENHGP